VSVQSNPRIAPWVNGSEGLYVSEVTLQPGDETVAKGLPGIEGAHYTLSGHGEELVGDEWVSTGPGSVVFIPSGAFHQVRNTGSEPLRILAITTPPVSRPS
jgi:mannose-6-phosphate isomerase-like protein (cupin superfamily)